MAIEAKIIADSISPAGARITSLELTIHRFILPELTRHRAFSLSVSSSRAMPLEKATWRVEEDPAMPIFWGRAQAGMQATESLSPDEIEFAKKGWLEVTEVATRVARRFARVGLHKQIASRWLETASWSRVLCTSTDYTNFFALRMHKDAQPEVQAVAVAMARAMRDSEPVAAPVGYWHLPYVTLAERSAIESAAVLRKVSAARCARTSFLTHDGREPDLAEDLKLFERLMGGDPKHSSPSEHQAHSTCHAGERSGNFRGWIQHRQLIEGHTAPPDFDWRARLAEYDAAGTDYIV